MLTPGQTGAGGSVPPFPSYPSEMTGTSRMQARKQRLCCLSGAGLAWLEQTVWLKLACLPYEVGLGRRKACWDAGELDLA